MDEKQPVPDDEQGSSELVDRGEPGAHANVWLIVGVVAFVVLVGIPALLLSFASAMQSLNGI